MTQSEKRPTVTIYTDGACSGNPGPGGYGIILLNGDHHRKELSGGYKLTTNNRMELLAVIVALESLKIPCDVKLHSDSQYIINAINEGWLENWISRNWRKADKKPVLNQDLWKRLVPLLDTHNVSFAWTKGHAGDPLNERCDELAVAASHGDHLLVDSGVK
ncbi:MAG TPA: ribonuclease HI [Candidatus Kapabacteria bacterium]|nr:ribonuclease HI [Candidatus Kapabacteria bacterium]